MTHRLAAAIVASVIAVAVAVDKSLAADIGAPVYKAAPVAALAFSWTGFYGGIHAGYGWADGSASIGIVDLTGITQAAAAAGVFPQITPSIATGTSWVRRSGTISKLVIGCGAWKNISATGLDGSQTL